MSNCAGHQTDTNQYVLLYWVIIRADHNLKKPSPESKIELPKFRTNVELSGGGSSVSSTKNKAETTKTAKATPSSSAKSSSTKQPHPILKKPRGPSSTGPRPTARFVSPPGSDGEGDDGKDSEIASSGSTAVHHSGDSKGSSNSTAKEERRKMTSANSKKKTNFVASTASKRRPAMPRRISSQSSTAVGGSEAGSKERVPSLGSRNSGQGSIPTNPEKPTKGVATETVEASEWLSAKAAGKRPVARLSPDKSNTQTLTSTPTSDNGSVPSGVRDARPNLTQLGSPAKIKNKVITADTSHMTGSKGGIAHRRSDTQDQPRLEVAPFVPRSRSDMGSSRRSSQELTRSRAPPQGLIASSTTTVSNTTVQGTILEYDEKSPISELALSPVYGKEDSGSTGSRRSGNSILDTRLTPTQPSPTPSVPLGRSKSQLTLLLERQGDKKTRR